MKIFVFYRVDIINISSIIKLLPSRGILSKTAQFWVMYIDMMKMQHQAHTAMQENNYDPLLHALQQFLLLYFNFNMQSYARYGVYYADMLSQVNTLYPGLKDTLSSNDLSIEAQDRYPLRTAVAQSGEQTINRDGKTSGGIRNVASSSSFILKWCLNR